MQAKRYWIQTSIIAFVAAIFGAACYVTAGIVIARGEMNASGAHHQIGVAANVTCDCIIKFAPVQPLAGSGTLANPFVTYVSYADVVVGFSGTGRVSVEDEDGVEVWAEDQLVDEYQEYTLTLDLLNGIGLYHFTVLVDGSIQVGSQVLPVMYIDYRQIPVPPEPPTTGGRGPMVYVGGYAASALGVFIAGAISGGFAFLIAFFIALGKKKREDEEEKADKAAGKKMSRVISPKSINTAGVTVKKPVKKAPAKKVKK